MTGQRALLIVTAAMILAAACARKTDTNAPGAEPSVAPTVEGEDVEPIADPAQPIYVGRWAGDPAACAVAPGSSDAAPIVITEGEFIGYENLCLIGATEEGTEGGWRLELVCEADGVEYLQKIDIDIDGDLMRLSREGAAEVELKRCNGK